MSWESQRAPNKGGGGYTPGFHSYGYISCAKIEILYFNFIPRKLDTISLILIS